MVLASRTSLRFLSWHKGRLLWTLPTAIRDGGGAAEWLWKGGTQGEIAYIDIETGGQGAGLNTPTGRPLRYKFEFTSKNNRVEVLDEAIEEKEPDSGHSEPYFYYRFQQGRPVINIKEKIEHVDNIHSYRSGRAQRHLQRHDLIPGPICPGTTKGSGTVPGSYLDRATLRENPDIPGLDFRTLRPIEAAAGCGSPRESIAAG